MLNFLDYLLTDEAPVKTFRATANKKLSTPFLRGPIPMNWINTAALLNGSALIIGLVLWHISGLNKQNPTVIMRKSHLEHLKLSRQTRYRALAALKKAGLISIEQLPGQLPSVTILS